MSADLLRATRQWFQTGVKGWDRFWFTPRDPNTLALLRLLAGLVVFYTHAVWACDFAGFFGPHARVSRAFALAFHESAWAWSHFFWIDSRPVLHAIHIAAVIVTLLFAIGLWTRWTSVLTFLICISYVHRAPGALFGLDQVNCFLTMYLMLSRCGDAYSCDSYFRNRQGRGPIPATRNNIATRLIQIHMCIVYLFAGLGKLQGASWWDGNAMWLALANAEYQTVDMTWVASTPLFVNFVTLVVVAWELSYTALIWPRWSRPIMLGLAIPVHLGIAITMGMATFGSIMLFGNLAFVPPSVIKTMLPGKSKQ